MILLRISLIALAAGGTLGYVLPSFVLPAALGTLVLRFGKVEEEVRASAETAVGLLIAVLALHLLLIGMCPLVLALFTGAGRAKTRLAINLTLKLVLLVGIYGMIRPANMFGESMGQWALILVVLPAIAALLLANLPQTLAHFRRPVHSGEV